MGGAEGVVFALGAAGEAGQAVFLAQRADAVAAAGQDLVRIALVADIEDQPVVGRVEDVVDGDRQFDHAEAGAEMAAGARDRIDHLGAQFARQAAAGRDPRSFAEVGRDSVTLSSSGVLRRCVSRVGAQFLVILGQDAFKPEIAAENSRFQELCETTFLDRKISLRAKE